MFLSLSCFHSIISKLSYVPDLYCMTGLRLLCCLNRSSCNIILVLVRIWSEQKKENDCYKDQSYDRSDSKGTGACNNQADLIYAKCYNISKNVLEENCKPEPFSGLHLMCHCRNSCKARRVKQVEQQERKCCYCCREPCFGLHYENSYESAGER